MCRHRSYFFSLLVLWGLVISGCGAATNGTTNSGMKVGLHIDAVLEFVVEYPLQWDKERRLVYGKNEGEVRWTDPEDKETLFFINSLIRQPLQNPIQTELQQFLNPYPGLRDSPWEKTELPAGEAWHVKGQTAQLDVEIYVLSKQGRIYKITLLSDLDTLSKYDSVKQQMIGSFQVLNQQMTPQALEQ